MTDPDSWSTAPSFLLDALLSVAVLAIGLGLPLYLSTL